MGYGILMPNFVAENESIKVDGADINILGLSLYSQGEEDVILITTDALIGCDLDGICYLEFSDFKCCGNFIGKARLMGTEVLSPALREYKFYAGEKRMK